MWVLNYLEKRIFFCGWKVKDLEIKKILLDYKGGSCVHRQVCLHIFWQRRAFEGGDRNWSDTGMSQGTDNGRQKLGQARDKSSLEPMERVWPCQLLGVGLLTAKTERTNFCCSKLWGLFRQPQELLKWLLHLLLK